MDANVNCCASFYYSKKNSISSLITPLLTSLFLLLSVANCYALTIDEFEEDGSVRSSSINSPETTNISGTAIGGNRYMETVKLSGFLSSKLETTGGLLSHTNEVGTGRSRIVWDGDNLDSFDATGLGGIDLTADGTGDPTQDGVIVNVFLVDASVPVTITIRAYSDSTKVSELRRVVSSPINWPNYSGGDIQLKYLFKDFQIVGLQAVDWKNIGALELEIDQNTVATDIMITKVITNGCSSVVPTTTSTYNDQCGVLCGTDACLDCQGVPNGTDQPGGACDTGELGVCSVGTWTGSKPSCSCERNVDPSNETCDALDNNCDGSVDETFTTLGDACSVGEDLCEIDGIFECNSSGGVQCSVDSRQNEADQCDGSRGCDGIPNSGLVDDACGVCGGDGLSCADCAGVPNGTAELDRCDVCNGDGQSCVQCNSQDIQDLQASLDSRTKDQENLAVKAFKKLKVAARRAFDDGEITRRQRRKELVYARSLRNQVIADSAAQWEKVWTELPSQFQTCSNSFCVSTSNASVVSSFLATNTEIENAISSIANAGRSLAIQADEKRLIRFFNRTNTKSGNFSDQNETVANQVPLEVSNCD